MFAVCAAVFAVLLVLNRLTGLHDDDYHFSFVFYDLKPVAGDRRVESIADIFLSVKNYYLLSGGRVVSHFLVYLMLFIGKQAFNIINSLVFVAFGLLLLKTVCVKKSLAAPALLIIIYSALWLFLPMAGETLFWVSGSINYLWMACVDLAFMLCYINYAQGRSRLKNNAFCALLMFVFGTLAGATNENSGGAVLLILFAYFIMCKRDKIKIPAWAYSGVAGMVIGIIVLVAAPGNRNRAANVEDGRALIGLSNVADKSAYILGFITEKIAYVILGIVVVMVLILIIKKNDAQKRRLNLILIYLGAGIASMLVLALTPEYLDRPFFFGVTLTVLSFACSLTYLGEIISEKAPANAAGAVKGAACLAALAAMAVSMRGVYSEFVIAEKFSSYQRSSFSAAAQRGESTAAIEQFNYECSTYCLSYRVKNISASPEDYINQWLARYYGFEKVYCSGSVTSTDVPE